MSDREPGYYWVKFQGDWIVGEYWDDGQWKIYGQSPWGEFDEIDERRIIREEVEN